MQLALTLMGGVLVTIFVGAGTLWLFNKALDWLLGEP